MPSSETAQRVSQIDLLDALEKSISVKDGYLPFTLPESNDVTWNIQMYGCMEHDGMGMSVHYLEEENEEGLWKSGETYSVQLEDGGYTNFNLSIFIPDTGTEKEIDLLPLLK